MWVSQSRTLPCLGWKGQILGTGVYLAYLGMGRPFRLATVFCLNTTYFQELHHSACSFYIMTILTISSSGFRSHTRPVPFPDQWCSSLPRGHLVLLQCFFLFLLSKNKFSFLTFQKTLHYSIVLVPFHSLVCIVT